MSMSTQGQYFDGYRLDAGGVTPVANGDVKKRLGFADVQRFSREMLDAVRMVASTSLGDDCGEGGFIAAATATTPRELRDAWRAAQAAK